MADLKDDVRSTRAYALAVEIRTLVRQLRRRLREQADTGDLTGSQQSAVVTLDRDGPMTVSALARAEGMRPQSMGQTVAALETLGLVAGSPDPEDGRQTIISLTPACRKTIKAGRAARQDWLMRTIETRLTAQEQEKLSDAVDLLKRLVD
ncbi:MAG TPA: MarR family transcriptional regulator [Hyphomonadaceae bacterium]|nr:MarR family transcriptional regulator [Hyphomonadaceae bacterium]